MTSQELEANSGTAGKILGAVEINGESVIIKIDPNASPESIKRTILHEIRHTMQDPKAIELHSEKAKNLDMSDEKAVKEYFEDALERDADEWADKEIKAEVEYNEATTNKGNVNKAEDTSSIRGLQDNGRDSSLGVQQVEGDGGSLRAGTEPTTSTRPISDRIKDTNGDLNQIDNIVNDVVNSDVKLSGTDWQAFAEDTDELYAKLKAICGKNLAAFKEAFANGDIDLVNYMTRKALR